MNLWNVKNLPVPTRNTYKSQNRSIDLPTLQDTISKAIYILTKPAVSKEAALLSRCIYRMKKKFRNDKGFKCMEKMNRALLQMLRLRFTDTLKTYLETIPNKYDADTYLPTLNMLHYILVRLQGLSKLLVRLCEVSLCAASFMQERIHIAHMWKVAFITFSMIARIYVLGKELLQFCCEFYGQLFPYCSKFKNVGADWLPNNYVLPSDLKMWLAIDWLDQDNAVCEEEFTPNISVLDVDSDSDVELCEENVSILEDVDVLDDIGEAAESLKKPPSKNKSRKYSILPEHTDVVVPSLKKRQINNSSVKKLNYSISCSEEDIGESVKRLKKPLTPKLSKTKSLNLFPHPEDLGEALKPLHKPRIPKKSSNYSVTSVNTLDELERLAKDFYKIKSENPKAFKNMDKLQCNMLHSLIKRNLKKAKKHRTDNVIVNKCITDVKELYLNCI